jgi:anaerobic ribonucleoside-triphosphate reductase activating protein
MNFHGIEKDSMLNGDGLRVVLWVSGCNHHCKGCHNPQTWDINSGREFAFDDLLELMAEVNKRHVAGLTISGGDPLHPDNWETVHKICKDIKNQFPRKTIWVYTGYEWEDVVGDLCFSDFSKYVDVIVDGEFIEELKDVNYPWAGSTNQRVIDVKKSLEQGEVVLWRSK